MTIHHEVKDLRNSVFMEALYMPGRLGELHCVLGSMCVGSKGFDKSVLVVFIGVVGRTTAAQAQS